MIEYTRKQVVLSWHKIVCNLLYIFYNSYISVYHSLIGYLTTVHRNEKYETDWDSVMGVFPV